MWLQPNQCQDYSGLRQADYRPSGMMPDSHKNRVRCTRPFLPGQSGQCASMLSQRCTIVAGVKNRLASAQSVPSVLETGSGWQTGASVTRRIALGSSQSTPPVGPTSNTLPQTSTSWAPTLKPARTDFDDAARYANSTLAPGSVRCQQQTIGTELSTTAVQACSTRGGVTGQGTFRSMAPPPRVKNPAPMGGYH